jgi:hypothetical protein
MTFTILELWTSNDINLFRSIGFQICITNVSCPNTQMIKFSKIEYKSKNS